MIYRPATIVCKMIDVLLYCIVCRPICWPHFVFGEYYTKKERNNNAIEKEADILVNIMCIC